MTETFSYILLLISIFFSLIILILLIYKKKTGGSTPGGQNHSYEDLFQSKELADLANKAKSEFLANISHEIRTPLNNIQGYIELMEHTSLNVEQYKFLHIINKSAKDLLGLINDVLDFSKIENMKMEIDRIPFKFVSEIQSVLELFNLKANKKKIKLLSYIEPDIPSELTGDPLRIKQVLTNILGNAVKFTQDEGIINLDITRVKEDEKHIELCISVKDNGIGIAEKRQKEIFESFVQEGRFVSSSYGGTGLGLSICKNLVDLMGGDLKLESKRGSGSRFYFNLEFDKNPRKQENEVDKEYNHTIKTAVLSESKDDILHKNLLVKYLNSMNFHMIDISPGEETGEMDLLFFFIDPSQPDKLPGILKGENDYKKIALENNFFVENSDSLKTVFDATIQQPLNAVKILKTVSALFPGSPYGFGSSEREDKGHRSRYKAKVLVAEDNADSRNFVKLMLNKFGIKTDTAENGLAAVKKIEKNRYDLIFLDINMPVYNGMEVVEIAHESEKEMNREHTPIVSLTARAIKGDRELFISSGFDDYIAKPVNMKKLEKILLKYLGHLKESKPESRVSSEETDTPEKIMTGEYYDADAAAAEMGIGKTELLRIVSGAFPRIDKDLEQLNKAINDIDLENIYTCSHKLKGTFYNFLFNEIGDIAREMEISAYEKKVIDYSTFYNKIKEGLELLKENFRNRETRKAEGEKKDPL